MKRTSFDRYCEYRSNKNKYELMTSIPAIVILFTIGSVLLKWFLIAFFCYFIGMVLIAFAKGVIHK